MCVCPQHHSHELAGPQLRRGGRKKAALSGGKTILIMHSTSETRGKKFSVSKCELRKAATEASTGHTSPFKPNGEATLQETSLPPRRKCVHSSKATRVLTKNMYPLLYQALHPRRKSSPEESNFHTHKQHPDTRNKNCQKQGHEEIMYQIPRANCAST